MTSVMNEETEFWEWGLNPMSVTHSDFANPVKNYARSQEGLSSFQKVLITELLKNI